MSVIQTVKDDLHNAKSYIVTHESYMVAWLGAHPWVWAVVSFLGGWAVAAVVYHHK